MPETPALEVVAAPTVLPPPAIELVPVCAVRTTPTIDPPERTVELELLDAEVTLETRPPPRAELVPVCASSAEPMLVILPPPLELEVPVTAFRAVPVIEPPPESAPGR